jgi:hypothetical protein
VTFTAILLYFNTIFTHFTQSVRKITQIYTFMRPVGGGACAAHTTFPHTFHKVSHTLTYLSQSFTHSSHIFHTPSQNNTPSNTSFTHLSQSLHKVFTNPSQFNPPLPSVAAALAPLFQPSSQRSHKAPTSPL